MSDYTIAVSWSGKDALADSDANKVISGGDFNTEFTAVQTAINSKADIASETLTGTPLAPTAASGTNTTQIATTAFVRAEIADRVYPVGAIFTTVTAYANSAAVVTAIGGTTWVAFGAGKVLVGLDSGDTDFDTVEETGGSKTDAHTLTTSEIPSHTHTASISSTIDTGDNQKKKRLNGTVKWFNEAKGYGFIKREDKEKDVFVHLSAIQNSGLDYLKKDEELTFEIENSEKGPSAINLQKKVNGISHVHLKVIK